MRDTFNYKKEKKITGAEQFLINKQKIVENKKTSTFYCWFSYFFWIFDA